MGRNAFFPIAWRMLTVVAAVHCAGGAAAAAEPSLIRTYFSGLRERGLFGVAERYGLDRRAELPVESAESVQLAVELSRTFARHALQAADVEEQAFLQSRADEALADYRGNEHYPRIQAVTLERTYRLVDRAELARWSWTADPEDADARADAGRQLDLAREALESWVDAAVTAAARPAADRTADDLTRRELAVLIHAARLRAIDLALLSAELASTERAREQLIRAAEDRMQKLAGSAERGTSAALRAYSIRIARLTGSESQLRLLVRQATRESAPLDDRENAVAELARYELDQGRHQAAAEFLLGARESLGEVSDRLRALHVEAVLGLANNAGPQRAEHLVKAEAENALITGPWRYRTGFLIEQARQVAAYGARGAELVRLGNREFRNGDRDAAIETFRAAADAATVPTGRAELRFMTASLLVEAQRYGEAIAECQLLLRGSPATTLAARASLLIAYCRGRLFAETNGPQDRAAYEQALLQHLDQYPGDETAGDAAWMLGSLAAQEGRLAGIVDADRRMPAKHSRAEESLTRAARAVLRALEAIHAAETETVAGRTAAEWRDEAQRLSARLLGSEGNDLAAARRRLDAARLLSTVPDPRFSDVLAILERLPQRGPDPAAGEEWRRVENDAAALRLVCLVAIGRFRDAAAVLHQLNAVSVNELLDVLRRMNAAGGRLDDARRMELARLELETIKRIRLQGTELSAEDQQLLTECEAEALFASAQYDEAIRMFEQAGVQNPELQPRLAEALERRGRQADLERARGLWEAEQASHREGTEPWFRARLHLVRLLLRLGQPAESRRWIRITRLGYPDLGGPELKKSFEECEQHAERQAG